jgi:hypothetical protein
VNNLSLWQEKLIVLGEACVIDLLQLYMISCMKRSLSWIVVGGFVKIKLWEWLTNFKTKFIINLELEPGDRRWLATTW